MLIYLVRHGEALSEQEDPSRPLSASGKRSIETLGGLLSKRLKMYPGRIYHSPKARAAQTAALLFDALATDSEPVQTDGLLPLDDPGLWSEKLGLEDRDVMLVGHLPHLSRLASLLLTWDAGKEILDFTPGTIVCLERSGSVRVKWMLSPKVLKTDNKVSGV